jgi:predicted NBD/HSP70 family sugar kinase
VQDFRPHETLNTATDRGAPVTQHTLAATLRLKSPAGSSRTSAAVVASTVAKLVASGTASSKADLVRATGLARTTVDTALAGLRAAGVVRPAGLRAPEGRGRPAEMLELDPGFGVVLVADCGAISARLGVFDLGQRALAIEELDVRMDAGPDVVLDRIVVRFRTVLGELGLQDVRRTVVVGLPGPVDAQHGTVVRPPIMPGWDGEPVAALLGSALGCEAIVENDVNLRALGETRALDRVDGPLLYVKVGTGIGGGLVTPDGELLHGADGAAGDIGHVRVAGSTVVCACGNIGCLEAEASLATITRELEPESDWGLEASARVLARIAARDPEAVQLVRERAVAVGEVVANLVHFVNPTRVVVGGSLAAASDDLLAGIRSVVYQRALPLATRNLTLSPPVLGADSGLAGGLVAGIERALDPAALARAMRARPGV